MHNILGNTLGRIKILMKHYHFLIRTSKFKTLTTTTPGKDVEQKELWHMVYSFSIVD